MIEGAPLEQVVERVTMDEFSDYGSYDAWLGSNVVSMWAKMYGYREPNRDGPGGEDSGGSYQDAFPFEYSIGD